LFLLFKPTGAKSPPITLKKLQVFDKKFPGHAANLKGFLSYTSKTNTNCKEAAQFEQPFLLPGTPIKIKKAASIKKQLSI
jgi:hypothetical protein